MSRHKTLRLSVEDDRILKALARKLKRDEATVLRLAIRALHTDHAPTVLTGCAADANTVDKAAAELRACTEVLRELVHYVRVDVALYPTQPLASEKSRIGEHLDQLLTKAQEVRATLKALQRLSTGTIDFDLRFAKQLAEYSVQALPTARKENPVAARASETFIKLAAMFGLVSLPPDLGGDGRDPLAKTDG